MKEISFSATSDFKTYFQGYKLADQAKKRQVSILLAIIAGFLLYSGWSKEPMDENMTYAGILTVIYILVGRDFMMKIKVRNLWVKKGQKESINQYHMDNTSLNISSNNGSDEIFKWTDFTGSRHNDQVCILLSDKSTENWLTIPITNLSQGDRMIILSAFKENIIVKSSK